MGDGDARLSRRGMLLGLSAAGLVTLTGCAPEPGTRGSASPIATPTDVGSPSPTSTPAPSFSATASPSPTPTGSPSAPPTTSPSPRPSISPHPSLPPLRRHPAPNRTVTALPADVGSRFAWTCDDGGSAEVIRAYAALAERTGAKFTFFLNGSLGTVADTVAQVRPLVQEGLIQIGNHTWSHPDLTKLTDAQIRAELQRNHDFIHDRFGVDARPFYRPPFGFHNARVDAVAAGIGYTTPTLWYGSLADSSVRTPKRILALGKKWFLPAHIVIAHLNHPPVISVLDDLWQLTLSRGLETVMLNEVYSSRYHP